MFKNTWQVIDTLARSVPRTNRLFNWTLGKMKRAFSVLDLGDVHALKTDLDGLVAAGKLDAKVAAARMESEDWKRQSGRVRFLIKSPQLINSELDKIILVNLASDVFTNQYL